MVLTEGTKLKDYFADKAKQVVVDAKMEAVPIRELQYTISGEELALFAAMGTHMFAACCFRGYSTWTGRVREEIFGYVAGLEDVE